jgi:hypothetical protein
MQPWRVLLIVQSLNVHDHSSDIDAGVVNTLCYGKDPKGNNVTDISGTTVTNDMAGYPIDTNLVLLC